MPRGYTANQTNCVNVALSNGGSSVLHDHQHAEHATFVVNKGLRAEQRRQCQREHQLLERHADAVLRHGLRGDAVQHDRYRLHRQPDLHGDRVAGADRLHLDRHVRGDAERWASCTITNTLNSATLNVLKDFIPNNAANVTVAVTCTSGTVNVTDNLASESDDANATITGFTVGATCTATETVPAGYTANQAACASVAITVGEIVELHDHEHAEQRDIHGHQGLRPEQRAGRSRQRSPAAAGHLRRRLASATEATPFTTTVTGYTPGATCTATESVPAGYSSTGTCTGSITGTPAERQRHLHDHQHAEQRDVHRQQGLRPE